MTVVELNERDLKIIQHALGLLNKKFAKMARAERCLSVENGQFCELEEYTEHLERRIMAALGADKLEEVDDE